MVYFINHFLFESNTKNNTVNTVLTVNTDGVIINTDNTVMR